MRTAQKADPTDFLAMHAMAADGAEVIGSAVAAAELRALRGG
jgi:Na+-transporting methylmalonyl-CoA/oxaloacetate decarboxylase beta subunit